MIQVDHGHPYHYQWALRMGCPHLGLLKPEEVLMKARIGEMAGRVWKTLGEREEIAVSKLPQILKEKGEIVYQALGWLAREDKVDFHKKEGKSLVSLSQEERRIYRKSL